MTREKAWLGTKVQQAMFDGKCLKREPTSPAELRQGKQDNHSLCDTDSAIRFFASHNKHQNKKVGGKQHIMQGGPDKTRTVHVTQKTSQEGQDNTAANTNNQLKIVRKREIQQQTWRAGLFTNRTSVVTERAQHKQQNKKMRKRN